MEIQNNEKYPDILKEWAIVLEGNRKKTTTINSYIRWVAEYLRFMKWKKFRSNKNKPEDVDISFISNILFNKIESTDIEAYKVHLIIEKKNTGRSLNTKLASLEVFYRYLKLKKIVKDNIFLDIEKAEEDVKQKKPLSLEDTRKLLKSIKNKNCRYEIRDYCMFMLFVDCGFRKEELANLKMNQIYNMKSVIFSGKGAKEREVKFKDDSIPVLIEYLKYRKQFLNDHNYITDYVFVNPSGDSIKSIGTILRKYTDSIGLKNCTPHTLRRTAATLRHKYGHTDIKGLQKMLGHSSITTTQRYVELDEEEMEEVANSLPSII